MNQIVNDMQPLVSQGLRFTGNSYLQDFANGKVWAAMVWSGDLASSGSADDTFVFPEEGTMIWSDNMLIPKGAQHQRAAEAMMNWVYQPNIAAQIEDYVYYVCPVKGADAEIKKIDPPAATNPLIFPTPAVVAKQHPFKIPVHRRGHRVQQRLQHPDGLLTSSTGTGPPSGGDGPVTLTRLGIA